MTPAICFGFFFLPKSMTKAPMPTSIGANDDGFINSRTVLSELTSPSLRICAVTVLPTFDPNTTGNACASFMIPAFTKPLIIMVTAAEL